MTRRVDRLVRPALIAPLAALLYVSLLLLVRGDPFILVTIGSQTAPPELQPHAYSVSGYDGQFSYYLARYGLGNPALFDVPAYRAQRILLPALAAALAFGSPDLMIWSLVAINLFALALAAYWLELLLLRRGAPVWPALGLALSVGMIGAVRMTTNEVLAYALVLGSLVSLDRNRTVLCGAFFGLAALAKEPTLVCAAGCVLACMCARRWRAAAMLAALSISPFALWQFQLFAAFGTSGIGSGGHGTTGFEWVPIGGFLRLFDVPREFRGMALVAAAFAVVFVIAPALWSLWRLGLDAMRGRRWEVEHWVLFVNAALVLFVPASTLAEPVGILRLIVGLQIGVVLVAARDRLTRPLRLTGLWACAMILVLAIDFA